MTLIRLRNNEARLERINPDSKISKHRNSILSVADTRKIDQMQKCWNLRVRGYSVAKISATLGISGPTVLRRLQDAKKLLETQLLKLDENDQETLKNRLEYVYEESTTAWEKSKTTAITSLDDGRELIQTNPGDPRFLLTALETLKTKQKLMGLGDRTGNVQVNVSIDNQIVEAVSQRDRMSKIAAELQALGFLGSGSGDAITIVPESDAGEEDD